MPKFESMSVLVDGVKISNESGHYGPNGLSMAYVKKAFLHWQASLREDLQIDKTWEVFGNQ